VGDNDNLVIMASRAPIMVAYVALTLTISATTP
jgi:hypothetical protein